MFVLGCELIGHRPARNTVSLESHRCAWPPRSMSPSGSLST
jgi:hypothetical protein